MTRLELRIPPDDPRFPALERALAVTLRGSQPRGNPEATVDLVISGVVVGYSDSAPYRTSMIEVAP